MSWLDNVSEDVRIRLCDCRSIKSDIAVLAKAKWLHLQKNGGYAVGGYGPEDALVMVLELLDCNGLDCDLTEEEYNDILREIRS